MFCVESNPQLNQDSFCFSENAEYPYFTRTVNNNGILGYVEYLDEEHLIKGDSIAVGMLGMQFFYMGHDFYAGQFTKTIFAKGFTLNFQLGLFFISLFNQCQDELKSVLVRDFEEKFLSLEIELPIRCNQIDSDYIEKYVNGLIVDNIFLINSFLDTHSLSDCTLTSTEDAALQQLLRDEVSWKPVPMNMVFTPLKAPYLRKGTRRQDHVSRIRTKEFCLPVVCAKRGDNGIMKYGRREDFTAHSNVLSIIYNGAIAAGLVYAHKEDVGIFTDSYLIKWKGEDIPFDVNLFLKTAIQKKIYPIYSREQKATWQNRVENEEIYLPINSNGEIDVEFMLTIVRAEKKIAARKVIAYKNSIAKEITTNRAKAIKPHCTTIPLHSSLVYNPAMMAAEPFECYKWKRFDQSICDFFGGDKTILIGCYKGKKYHDWINTNQIYNIRLGNTKGSMETNRELFDSTSLLVLYELGKPNKLSAHKIVGYKEMGKEELLAMDYPNKKPRKSYMTFSITPLEMDLTFLMEHHFIEKLIELNSENAKGTPVFIEP